MLCILVGTRPEIIKMAPVIRGLQQKKKPFILVHSNQHYTAALDAIFFRELQLPLPDFNLHAGSGTHAEQTAKILVSFEKICLEQQPSIVLVHGDTNTALAGALVGKKLHIPVAHVEAGLRSFDERMPEEINRCIIDRVANILFAPTEQACKQLKKEGIDKTKIVHTGNTIVDSVHQNMHLAQERAPLFTGNAVLVTTHRPSNVDTDEALIKVIAAVQIIAQKTQSHIYWLLHPRCAERVKMYAAATNEITCLDPVGYLDMLRMIMDASLIVTDSGGVQEEAFILKKPLITLRDTTERPETLSANFLCDTDTKKIEQALDAYKKGAVQWNNTLGSGDATQKIIDTLEKFV